MAAHDTTYDDVYVLQTDDEGKEVEVKIAKVRTLRREGGERGC